MNSRCMLFVLNFILRVKVVGFYNKGNIYSNRYLLYENIGKNITTKNSWSYSTIFYIVKIESGFKINILGEKMIGTHLLLLQKREDFFPKLQIQKQNSPFFSHGGIQKNNLSV